MPLMSLQYWNSMLCDKQQKLMRDRVNARHNFAFQLEAVFLTLAMLIVLAILSCLFIQASIRGEEANRLSQACLLATTIADNGAEAFMAKPAATAPDAADESAPAEGKSTAGEIATGESTAGATTTDAANGAANETSSATNASTADTPTSWVSYYKFEDGRFSKEAQPEDSYFTVNRQVTWEEKRAGILYYAHISVWYDGRQLYELDTARYVGADAAADASADAAADAAADVSADGGVDAVADASAYEGFSTSASSTTTNVSTSASSTTPSAIMTRAVGGSQGGVHADIA